MKKVSLLLNFENHIREKKIITEIKFSTKQKKYYNNNNNFYEIERKYLFLFLNFY